MQGSQAALVQGTRDPGHTREPPTATQEEQCRDHHGGRGKIQLEWCQICRAFRRNSSAGVQFDEGDLRHLDMTGMIIMSRPHL